MKCEEEFRYFYLKGEMEKAFNLRDENFPENMKLYKYQNIAKYRISSLLKGYIYFSKRSALNDPFELDPVYYDIDRIVKKGITIEQLKKIMKDFYENMGVLSLSSRPDNMPLWTHYGDEHKGICVEYDINSIDKNAHKEFYNRIFKAVYTSERIDITSTIERTIEMIKNNVYSDTFDKGTLILLISMLIKQKDWLYEDEWRILWELEECNEGCYKSPMKVSAIYMGKDCNKDDINLIKEVANSIKCDLYKMAYSEKISEYRLTYEKVEL